MANKVLKSLTFPGLNDVYKIPQEADEYSASATYAVGDYCIKDGVLYRCTTAITTAEAWTAGHWTATQLADEVTSQSEKIETAITQINSTIYNGDFSATEFVQGSRDAYGVIGANAYICTSKQAFTLLQGDTITVKNIDSGLKILIASVKNGSFVFNSSWQTAEYTHLVNSSTAGLFFVNVGKNDGTTIAPTDISTVEILITPANKINKLEESVGLLSNELVYKSTIDSPDISGIINTTGGFESTSTGTFLHTDYIAIPNDCLAVEYTSAQIVSNQYILIVAFYDINKKFISGVVPNGGTAIVELVPEKAAFVAFGSNTNGSGNTPNPATQKLVRSKFGKIEHPKRANAKITSFTSGTYLSIDEADSIRKNGRLVFRADIASWGSIEIGFITQANASGVKYNRLSIGTNGMTCYTHYDYLQEEMASEVVQHNLGISSGNIQVVMEETEDAKCIVTLMNNGNTYTHTFDNYCHNMILVPYVYTSYTILANADFTWSCTDLNKDIWLFGDSYLSYEEARWAYYLNELGYDKNVLINAHPGCTSGQSIRALKNLIRYNAPKFIVWELGMNDGSDSTEPSTTWANARDELLSICEEYNIIPVFGTIPTVATVNNEQKNAWIRSSGYRYIDFAKAVGANSSGVWYGSMLSSDGVHPSIDGAHGLYAEALLDFPEIMIG